MDKGAHFFKCDFQVHTPRDIGWTGRKYGAEPTVVAALTLQNKAEIDTERKQFCKDYLNLIRQKGINAVAITDHHDVVFAKLLRAITLEENSRVIEAGHPDECITVFPGMELTLSNPASQCLLIFDADFPDANLDSVVHFLGIEPNPPYTHSTVPTVQRISQDIIRDLNDLHNKLDEKGYCVGKYIALPNINKSGGSTILRGGFQEHYIKMPCSGGYVDKVISDEAGYRNKLNGGDVNYGNKAIAIISTSDNRYEDGRELGQHVTWVKWAEPTAEALRQACLARQSRIAHVQPPLPQIYITGLDVTNSKFLSSFSIQFNRQYSALIGGRGTGKSTILEYLRWGLCDQTVSGSDSDESTRIDQQRSSLVDKTLVPFGGAVRVTFDLNGIVHIVKRDSGTGETVMKIDDGEFEPVKEEEVRRILPIQAYSQKQLSGVAVRTEELRRFIQQPVANLLNTLRFELGDISKALSISYSDYLRQSQLNREIGQFKLETRSLTSQVAKLRASLSGISQEDQSTIAKKQLYDNERNRLDSIQTELVTISNRVTELGKALARYNSQPAALPYENSSLMNEIEGARRKKLEEASKIVLSLQKELSDQGQSEIRELIQKWHDLKKVFESQYQDAKAKSTANTAQLKEIEKIEATLSEINQTMNQREATLKELGEPEQQFRLASERWVEAHRRKVNVLQEQCKRFSELSAGLIKADIIRGIDLRQLKSLLTMSLQGTRINETKIEALCEAISEADHPLDAWISLLDELRQLAELRISGDEDPEIPELQMLDSCDFNDGNKRKIVELLLPEKWVAMATTEIEFNPRFSYTTNNIMGDVIPFEDASAGQQATALLTVLLNQAGMPLIIDQPEDDIDNRAISNIIETIWQAKKSRQLVFTSHNANLVVNGDAELVVCCDYREAGNQTRGMIKAEGAIDTKPVRDEITAVMEGGEKAFRLRKEKYGF